MEIKGSTLTIETSKELSAFAILTGLAVPMFIIPPDNSLPKRVVYTHVDEAGDAFAGIKEQLDIYSKS
ncbi:MAG: hypothetical protein WCG44_03415 [bacterium]